MAIAPSTVRDVSPIRRQISRLRRALLRWVLVQGLGRILCVALLVAAADMFLDRVFRMDFSQRAIMLGLMTAVMLWALYRFLFRPLERRPPDDALVLAVERRNRQFHESLISGWQLSREQAWLRPGVSPDLVQATIDTGVGYAQQADFTDTLDQRRWRINAVILAAGLAAWALIAWGVTQHDFLKTWFNRNLLLGDMQWPQATYLEIEGVQDGQLVIDRGANYDLNVMITEQSRVFDVDVDIEIESDNARTIQETNPTGRFDGRQRQLTLHNVSTQFRLRAVGGDATTDWVDVRLVEPLDLAGLQLTIQRPDYVGGSELLTGGGPHTVLQGSRLELLATTNLPVEQVRLNYVPPVGSGSRSTEPGTAAIEPTTAQLEPLSETTYRIQLPQLPSGMTLASGKYQLELRDAGGRTNRRPLAFELAVVEDQAPSVAASLSGISGLIVPRATLPISFRAADQFGLTRVSIPYQRRTAEEAAELRTGELAKWNVTADRLEYSELDQEYAFSGSINLDLRPIQLPTGIVLRLNVAAQDNQPDPAAGLGQSREFLLRVVTEEELRADLLRRELESRALFQQQRDNQLQLMTELRALAAAVAAAPDQDQTDRQRQLLELRNRQKHIGTSLFQIAERFDSFLAEATNNRLDESEQELQGEIQNQTPSLVSFKVRYSQRIIDPIRSLDETEIYVATQGLEEAQNKLADAGGFAETSQQTADLQESIVRKMDEILAAMEESQTYQEIVNRVISLKRLEQSLLESIKNKQPSGNQPDIFD